MFKTDTDATTDKPPQTAAERAKVWSDYLGNPSPQPAARFMQTGGTPRPTSAQPAYKLRQKLADIDLAMRHPHLDKKWRKKIGGVPPVQTGKVVRGRQGAAKEREQNQ